MKFSNKNNSIVFRFRDNIVDFAPCEFAQDDNDLTIYRIPLNIWQNTPDSNAIIATIIKMMMREWRIGLDIALRYYQESGVTAILSITQNKNKSSYILYIAAQHGSLEISEEYDGEPTLIDKLFLKKHIRLIKQVVSTGIYIPAA